MMSESISPKDSEVERDRNIRWLFFLVTLIIFISIPTWLGAMIAESFAQPERFGLVSGVVVGAIFFGFVAIPYVSVFVPKWQGLTTLNAFTGNMVVYGPGWHPRLPWEQIGEDDHQSLRLVTFTTTQTYPTRDDRMKAEWSFQWRPRLKELQIFRGMDETTIDNGFEQVISEFLANQFSRMTSDEAKEDQQRITKAIEDELLGSSDKVSKMESIYAVNMELINLGDVDYTDEVQEARSAIAEAESFKRIIASMFGKDDYQEVLSDEKISSEAVNQAWNRALVIAEEVKQNIHSIDLQPSVIRKTLSDILGNGGGE